MRSGDIRLKQFSEGPGGFFRFFSEKFDADQVDEFLEQCARSLEAGERGFANAPLRGDDIVVKQFRYTRFGRGYDPDEVDDYLDEIVVALREHETSTEAEGTPQAG